MGDITWRVSDCEELVGGNRKRWGTIARSTGVISRYCLSLSGLLLNQKEINGHRAGEIFESASVRSI